MLPIELYPSDSSKKRGLIGSGFLFFLAYQAMTWSRADELPLLMWVFLGLGVMGLVPVARSYLSPSPSFAADAEGFSVMGKPKRGWDEFRGAEVRTLRYAFVPVSRTVVVKIGKSVLGRRIQIHPAHLSGPASEMAAEIQRYGQFMKTNAEAVIVARQVLQKAGQPTGQATRPEGATAANAPSGSVTPAPAMPRPFEDRITDGGPIASTPRLSERLFGRRKVI